MEREEISFAKLETPTPLPKQAGSALSKGGHLFSALQQSSAISSQRYHDLHNQKINFCLSFTLKASQGINWWMVPQILFQMKINQRWRDSTNNCKFSRVLCIQLSHVITHTMQVQLSSKDIGDQVFDLVPHSSWLLQQNERQSINVMIIVSFTFTGGKQCKTLDFMYIIETVHLG